MLFNYNIHIEIQFCKLNLQNDKKNFDLSHIISSDMSIESQILNESTPKKFNIKVEVIPLISQPNSLTYDHIYFRNKILNQYPTLFRKFSSKNFDYYRITDETLCLL